MDIVEYKPPQFEEVEITSNFIDLKKVIVSKNKLLLKFIPPFVFSFFKKLLHLDEINYLIYKNKNLFGVDFAAAILNDFGVKIEVINEGNIFTEGRYLFVSNHPLGGIDGMILISEIGKKNKKVLFPVNDLLMNLPGLRPIFVPINKYGRNSAENQNYLNNAFASDQNLLYFPAGLCSRKMKGEIVDLEWKKTFIKKAIEYQRDIIPVYVDAHNTKRFYNLANFRKKIGMKANIELILLPDEMFKQKGKTVKITFGKPIPRHIFTKDKSEKEWAALVKQHVYSLKESPNIEFSEELKIEN